VIAPLALQNAVNDFVNCDAAAQVLDEYSARTTMLLVGATNVVSSLFGNPFPGCIYVGHAAFKGMGARAGEW
jgi:AGZA family xanthine/uracil permease-like MFS transporter